MSAIITPLARRKPRTLRFFRWLWRHPAVTLGGFIVSLIVLAGLFAPLITRHDPYAQDLIDTLLPPDAGQVRVDGLDVTRTPRAALARLGVL